MIELTDRAKEYLKKVGKPNVSLTVKGGGCSGFQYVWGVTDEPATVANLWLNPIAEMFVFGCTIDYVEELGGSYLKVINPNAKASCGCGESFAV
tara:strand:- start:162 stop:443 length:282 start_codon:yes stop_codon:yes gene_type:complete